MTGEVAIGAEEQRHCVACGLPLVGPFQPKITLTRAWPDRSGEGESTELEVVAGGWICPGCGLLQWYADEEYLDPLLAASSSDEPLMGKPGTEYERRVQMLRMLRRVRRM